MRASLPAVHRLRLAACVALLAALLGGAGGPLAAAAHANGNASAAAGFIERAQNSDGGFGEKRGGASNPLASLWAATALVAAGKNPVDEAVKGGTTLDEYLAAHASRYRSLAELGLLTMVRSSAIGSSAYADPGARLQGALTPAAARSNPYGASLGIFGLLALGSASARQSAVAAAQALLASPLGDGGWGSNGLSDSASTALVLQALAATGVANATTPAVRAGVNYLHQAQANDGSIASSIRVDQAIANGSVTASAFTIQALTALGLPTLRTPNGKTVYQGLTQYQQLGTGGLTSDGSLYSQVPPSITETAQAFPAFDGLTFPFAVVQLSTPSSKGGSHGSAGQVSAGTTTQGVSGSSGAHGNAAAFSQATAANVAAGTHRDAGTAHGHAAKHAGAAQSPGGSSVSGEVVGAAQAPKLAAVKGQAPGGLTGAQEATLALVAALLACALIGGYLDARRPRQDGLSGAAVATSWAYGAWQSARSRGAFAPLAAVLVGAALFTVPFATRMFERAPHGAQMINAFAPYMTAARLAVYEGDVHSLGAAAQETTAIAPTLLAPHASAAAGLRREQSLAPQALQFAHQWPGVQQTFASLLGTIQANRGRFAAVQALPSFNLFPWFFIVPGALLVALGLAALIKPAAWRGVRWGVAAVAVGLVLAPLAFGMWWRAPEGEQMIKAFSGIETHALTVKLQNDFATITTGEGGYAGELVPAVEAHGISAAALAHRLPAIAHLETSWIGILNHFTPLLGVMNNNVANYEAVAALPRFGLFPWLFAAPGLLLAGIVILRALSSPRPLPVRRVVRTEEPQAA